MSDLVRMSLEEGIATVTLFRPEKRNAFNPSLRDRLADTLEQCVSDSACRGIVLAGEGPHFSVGGDVDAFASMTAGDLRHLLDTAHRCIRAIRRTPKPVVAAVEGIAAGGAAGLVLACDAIVAGRTSRIVFPFLRLGLVPDWGCVHLLTRKVGEGVARRLLSGVSTTVAEDGLASGVVDVLVEDGAALEGAVERVRQYLAYPGNAWGATKLMLEAEAPNLEAALERERVQQEACFHDPAFRQALARFLK